MDTVMEHIAKELGKDPLEIKRLNFYKQGDVSRFRYFFLQAFPLREIDMLIDGLISIEYQTIFLSDLISTIPLQKP